MAFPLAAAPTLLGMFDSVGSDEGGLNASTTEPLQSSSDARVSGLTSRASTGSLNIGGLATGSNTMQMVIIGAVAVVGIFLFTRGKK